MYGYGICESTDPVNVWCNDVKVCDIEEFYLPGDVEESSHLWRKAVHDGHCTDGASQPTSQMQATRRTETFDNNNDRLMNILKQASVAEHIRTTQSYYRDSEDDLKLLVSTIEYNILCTYK